MPVDQRDHNGCQDEARVPSGWAAGQGAVAWKWNGAAMRMLPPPAALNIGATWAPWHAQGLQAVPGGELLELPATPVRPRGPSAAHGGASNLGPPPW
jgi:hypothetical protein